MTFDVEILRSNILQARNLHFLDRAKYYQRLRRDLATQDDKDTLMLIASQEIRDVQDLYLVALSVRWGGNPNLYIFTANEIYQRHFLYFMILQLQNNRDLMQFDESQFNKFTLFAVLLFQELGANLDLPILKRVPSPSIDGSLIEAQRRMMNLVDSETDSLSVFLMKRYGYDSLRSFNQDLKKKNLTLEEKQCMTILTNKNLFNLEMDKIMDISVNDIILAEATVIFDLIPLNFKNGSKILDIYHSFYYKTVRSASYEMYQSLINNGVEMNYFDMNHLLQELNNPANADLEKIYYSFLFLAISSGVHLDTNQFKSVPDKYKGEITRIYQVPYIKKISTSRVGVIPKKLVKFVFFFGLSIEKTKAEMLDALNEIYLADVNTVANGVSERYKTRLASVFLPFLEFNKPSIAPIQLENLDRLKNPMLINDHQTIVIEGTDGKYYPFNSDEFRKLLSDGFIFSNEGDRMMLPILTQLEISKRLELLAMYDISPDDVFTVIEVQESLRAIDRLNNQRQEVIINTVDTTLLSNRVSLEVFKKTLVDFDSDKIDSLTVNLMYDNDEDIKTYQKLNPYVNLDGDHQRAVMYRLIDYDLKNHPERFQNFLNAFQTL